MREVRLVYLWTGGYQGRKRPQAFGVNFPKASSRRSAATTKDAASPEMQLSDSIQEGQGNVPGGYSQPSTLPDISAFEFVDELEEIDHKEFLPVSMLQWQRMKHAAAEYPVLQQLRNVIQCGWPESKAEVAPGLIPYYDSRDELTVQGDLVLKSQQLKN